MARYAYDVNTTTRLIDVHKQFNGGLKTVDTDDSLGAVFLRQAENVSLSEFGFIEKRYGTFENFKAYTGLQDDDKLQGYWEFYPKDTLYYIIAINGDFYVNGNKVTEYFEEKEEYRFPDFSAKFSWTKNNLTWSGVSFQETKEIGGIIKNDVIYFFTGTYPVYAKEDEGVLKFYLLPIEVPSYDEIVVVGHNLLENDYEQAYGFDNPIKYTPNGLSSGTIDTFLKVREVDGVQQKNFTPKIPFSQDGFIDFNFQYVLEEENILYDFRPEQELDTYLTYRKVDLDTIKFRNSGAGASNLDFINADKSLTDFVPKTNYEGTNEFLIRTSEFYLPRTLISGSEITDRLTIPNPILIPDNRKRKVVISTDYEPFEVTKINPNDTFEFTISKETGNSSDPYENVILPTNLSEYIDFLEIEVDESRVAGFTSSVSISIVPFDTERVYQEEEILIADADIEKSSSQTYRFTIPENIVFNTNIVGYQIKFNYEFETIYLYWTGTAAQPTSTVEMNNDLPSLYKQINKMEKLEETSSENYLKNYPDLGFRFTNLISGTYDFELTYSLSTFDLEEGILNQKEKKYYSVYFYNITITPEKLQDYSGSENVPTKLEALWECNNVIEHFNKFMVWGSKLMPNSVFYSFPDRPAYFPSKFYLDFGSEANDPVVAVTPYMNILVVQTFNTTWGIRGNSGYIDSPAPYNPFTINSTVGTIAPKSVKPIRNHLFFLSKIGVIALKSLYAADEQYNIEFVDRNIKNIVPQDPEAVGIQFDNQYWLNFPNFGITLRWYIDKKAWVLDSFGTYKNKITNSVVSKLGAWFQFNGVSKWQIVNGKLEFITHPSAFIDGENLSVYKIGVDYSLPTDLGQNVFTKFETSFLNQNYPFHPKNYKELKLDFTLQNEYNSSNKFIYSMDEAEHISDDVHKIDNVSLLKNHRYRIVYNFSQHTVDETVLDGGSFTEALSIELNGGSFGDNSSSIIVGNFRFSLLNAQDLQIRSLKITDKDNEQTILLPTEGFTYRIIENQDTYDEYVEFLLPNNIDGVVDIIVDGDFSTYNDGAVMLDITYDANLQIKNWVVSESATLNIEDFNVPDQSKVSLDLDFDSSLGEWVFGSSDFGNKVTAVKTVKLSGKGYNAKLYLEDETKSKWTLESLGLTYKMKRARSR